MQSRLRREGSVGLLIVAGIISLIGIFFWLRNFRFGQNSYQVTVEFPQASGIQVGSAVLFRGVQVGRVIALEAKANKVELVLEISPVDLQMPAQLLIEPSRYGLIGEALVDITPQKEVDPALATMNALSPNCNSQLIVCNGDRLQGTSSPQLLSTMSRLAELYTNPEFYERFNQALTEISAAGAEIATLSRNLSDLTKQVENDLQGLSANAERITDSLENSSLQINQTAQEIRLLSTNVNGLISDNRSQITETISGINATTEQVRLLSVSLEKTVGEINSTLAQGELRTILKNVETLTADLKVITQNLNQPENLLVIQETLDSARATFANAQKITADLDELTGDPQFRDNIRRLVNGLGSLVSSTQQLEQQVASELPHPVVYPVSEPIPEPLLIKPIKNSYYSKN